MNNSILIKPSCPHLILDSLGPETGIATTWDGLKEERLLLLYNYIPLGTSKEANSKLVKQGFRNLLVKTMLNAKKNLRPGDDLIYRQLAV